MFTWMFVKERFFHGGTVVSWMNGFFMYIMYILYTYIYAPKISEYLADSW